MFYEPLRVLPFYCVNGRCYLVNGWAYSEGLRLQQDVLIYKYPLSGCQTAHPLILIKVGFKPALSDQTAANSRRIKIPNVCNNMGVRWINDFQFLKELEKDIQKLVESNLTELLALQK